MFDRVASGRLTNSVFCVPFQMPPKPRQPIRTGRRRSLAQAAAASSPGSSSSPCWACGHRSPWFTSTWSTTRESWVSPAQCNQPFSTRLNRFPASFLYSGQSFDWCSFQFLVPSSSFFFINTLNCSAVKNNRIETIFIF